MVPTTTPETCIYLGGHTGLVGGSVLRALKARGYSNVLLRSHAQLDLSNQAQTQVFFEATRPEIVLLTAARVGGIWANLQYPYEFAQENLAIELNVIHGAFRNGVRRLIFLGSSCIYPKHAPQPLKEEYLLTGPLEETNRPYAVAKIAGIELCRSLNREYGTSYLALMPTSLFGPGDDFDLETGHLMPSLIRKFHEAKGSDEGSLHSPVILWGTGKPRRELLHVDDLAAAICLVIEGEKWDSAPDALLNVGTGEDLTVAELAVMVQRVVLHKGAIEWDEGRPNGTPRKLLDCTRIRGLGWRPAVGLEEGIRQTYEWFLETHENDERESR